MFTRDQTRALRIGSLPLGGGAPVSVQTMATADPHDAAALSAEVLRCAAAGADLVRLTVPDVAAARVLGEVRRTSPVPLVADIHFDHRCALAALEAGADALSLINTIPAMVIDVERRVPVLANRTGGLSGRGIHPVAVKLVYEAHQATKLPILAMGGVYEARDAIEFLLAGATAVAVGTATFTNPSVVAEVHDGIAAYCERNGFASVTALTGNLAA